VPNPIAVVQIVLLCLILVAACVTPILVYYRLIRKVRREVAQLLSRLDKHLAAGARLVEVQNYCQQTSGELKKMLDEAYKEGNRFRQQQIRKLMERLDTLKVRALDRAVNVLEPGSSRPPRKRRRRSRSRRKPGSSPNKPRDKGSRSTGEHPEQGKGPPP